VRAVTGMFGQGTLVLGATAASQGCSTAAVRRLVALIKRRARDHAALRSERAASIARRTAVERLTGGASLAVVLGSGAVRVPSMTADGRLVAAGLGLVEARPELWDAFRIAAETTADGVTAGLRRASRRWAVRQALLVAQELSEDNWRTSDAHAVRALHSTNRLPVLVSDGRCGSSAGVAAVGGAGWAAGRLGDDDGAGGHEIETSVQGRDTLSSVLCRVCLRYACRLHSTNPFDPLSAPPPAMPVRPPPDPFRLSQRRGCDYHGKQRATTSTPVANGGSLAAGSAHDAFSRPPQASVRRGRRASSIHHAIASVLGGCSNCRLAFKSHREKDNGHAAAAVGGSSADQIALLRAVAAIVGQGDTCGLARFVPGQSCRGVAEYIHAVGLRQGTSSAVAAPMEDPRQSVEKTVRRRGQGLLNLPNL